MMDHRHTRKKRKSEEPGLPAAKAVDDDITFVAKVEPPEITRSRFLKILVGAYTQSSTRGAVQDILKDPALFRCHTSLEGDACTILVPRHIDAYATHIALLAALNPGTPLNCKSTVNGLTLNKLHDAVGFLKIDGRKIGLEPLRRLDDSSVAAIQIAFFSKSVYGQLSRLSFADMLQVMQMDFLAVPSELDVYKVVKQWCEYDPTSRMTREILGALLAEIRWEYLVDRLEGLVLSADGPLREILRELQRYFPPKPKLTVERRFSERRLAETVLVFYADQNQAELRQYNWDLMVELDIPLPEEIEPWCSYKEMGPAIDGEHLLFRIASGKRMNTWSFSVVTKAMRYLFQQEIEHTAHYPLACISGLIYAWDLEKQGSGNRSFKFHPKNSKSTDSLSLPKHFREQAAFEAYNGKFYYCGGRSLAGGPEAVSTVEMYDPATNQWTRLPDMREPRRCFAARVYAGHLYVAGGACNSGTGVLNSCERLNLGTPKAGWKWIGGLNAARYNHCMIIAKGQLYVGGGLISKGHNRARHGRLERYDLRRDVWEKDDKGLRSPISSCVTFVMSYK